MKTLFLKYSYVLNLNDNVGIVKKYKDDIPLYKPFYFNLQISIKYNKIFTPNSKLLNRIFNTIY